MLLSRNFCQIVWEQISLNFDTVNSSFYSFEKIFRVHKENFPLFKNSIHVFYVRGIKLRNGGSISQILYDLLE